jgi:hypothetical protein
MLASTMQFSNNQHSRKQNPFPENPTTCPTRPDHVHVPRRSSTSELSLTVPNSQRSTHEQPAPDTRRCTGL